MPARRWLGYDANHRHGADWLPPTAVEVLDLLRSTPKPRPAKQTARLAGRCLVAVRRALSLLQNRGLARRVGQAKASRGVNRRPELWEPIPERAGGR